MSNHSRIHIGDKELPSTAQDQAEARAAVDGHNEAKHWMSPFVVVARGLQTCGELNSTYLLVPDSLLNIDRIHQWYGTVALTVLSTPEDWGMGFWAR